MLTLTCILKAFKKVATEEQHVPGLAYSRCACPWILETNQKNAKDYTKKIDVCVNADFFLCLSA